MTATSALAIILRHVEDSDEGGRACRACGRPWPCDVRLLVDAMTAEAHHLGTSRALSLTNGNRRSPAIIPRPASRLPRPAVREPVA